MNKVFVSLLAMAAGSASGWAGEISQEVYSGGETTVFSKSGNAFSFPLKNISRQHKREHVVGDSFFNKNWVVAPASTESRDGLGPLFNTRSCSACHFKDGRGRPPEAGEDMVSMLLRLSVPGQGAHGAPKPDPVYGGQLSEFAIDGVTEEGDGKVRYTAVSGSYPDGETYELLQPDYAIERPGYGEFAEGLMISPRVAPPVFGLGLLEAVPEETILGFATTQNASGEEISGRPNWVRDRLKQQKALGRFGWKANQPSLQQQSLDAFVGDIGITSFLCLDENHTPAQAVKLKGHPSGGSPELSDKIAQRVVLYMQTLAPPARRNWEDPEVQAGQRHFNAVGCADCHVPSMQTGNTHEVEELRNQTIYPYTDMLVHDMGEALADGRPDYEASGNEWRTSPLWGIGLVETVNGHTRFLHDGRARNLEEAILWHGGESAASRDAFKALDKKQRVQLLRFLESL